MKGVQILHNSTYDTITLLAGFYCTLFTEQVSQWIQRIFEVVLKGFDCTFFKLLMLDRKTNILRNYKKTKNVPSK
jgi:hypothetical protein